MVVREKQQDPRKRGRIRARYGVESLDRTAFTNNVSLSGAFLRTNMVFRPGTTIQLELVLPDETVQLWAQVIWSKKVPPQLAQTVLCGMGVRFVNVGPEWEAAFERWKEGKPKG
jgi:Tfp pilus assembly protein PilZ